MPRDQLVVLMYANHRGERAERRVLPERIWFGCTDWYPEPQWLLDAYDVDRQALRSFAMRYIEGMTPDTSTHVPDRSRDSVAAG